MVNPFQPNIPATNSPVVSSEVRDNFAALYDKLKTLEVQATIPPSTSVLVLGGPAYFRSGESNQLKLIKFNTTIFSFSTNVGYKTQRDNITGALSRVLQTFAGPSQFQTQGTTLEVLLSLTSSGSLVFTESVSAQNNSLSSPFNIYFDDSEIPISTIFLHRSGTTLQVISQTDINEARAIVSVASQNNSQTVDLQIQVEQNTADIADATGRIGETETSVGVTNNLKVRLPTADKLLASGTTTTNTLVQVLSGTAWTGTRWLNYAGGYVNFSTTPSSSPRVINQAIPAGPSLGWNAALISLIPNPSSSDITDNATLQATFASYVLSPASVGFAAPANGQVPLAYVLFRKNSSGLDVIPLISETSIGDVELGYTFPITGLQAVLASPNAYDTISVDVSALRSQYPTDPDLSTFVQNTAFPVGALVDITDSITKSARLTVNTISVDTSTNIATMQFTDSFVEISLSRSPTASCVSINIPIIRDARPLLSINTSGGYLSAFASAVAVPNTGSPTFLINIASITLTAGDWDITGGAEFQLATGVGATSTAAALSLVSAAAFPTVDHVAGDNLQAGPPPTSTYDTSLTIPTWRVNVGLGGTQIVYLKGKVQCSSGTPTAAGRLSARRVHEQ